MAKREETKAYLTIKEVAEQTGLCRPTARKLADEACAAVKVGRRVLVLSDKLDQYLHSMAK